MKFTNFEYTITKDQTRSHHILFNARIQTAPNQKTLISLPVWRPGRYEVANYAQYIKDFKATDESGKKLKYSKTHHSDWLIESKTGKINVSYSFYSDRLDAGFSYIDDHQIYLNPVNCFFYIREQQCRYNIKFDLSRDYVLYSPLKKIAKHQLKAGSFYELFDSPTVASNNARVSSFKSGKYLIKNVFQGTAKPDMTKLNRDFRKFIDLQIKCFGDLPVQEFTFINQITSHKFFHGVEHKKNTVLAFGPGYSLNQKNGYQRFLGLACHEFYHIWNVKHLRPQEMFPYDFSRENIHAVGYIIEGVTTYQGDVKLWQSKVIDDEAYFELLAGEINKHLNNSGRFNQSVRESSVDLWLDGYKSGVPGKKVSIYTEGCLLAMITDILLLEKTKGKTGLDDVMRDLYVRFAKKGKGYDEEAYVNSIRDHGGSFFSSLYHRLINEPASYESDLRKALNKVGLRLVKEPIDLVQSTLGIRIDGTDHPQILAILSGSPAEKVGLTVGYRIHSIQDINLNGNLDDWLQYFHSENIILGVSYKGEHKEMRIKVDGDIQYAKFTIAPKKKRTASELKLFKSWRKY